MTAFVVIAIGDLPYFSLTLPRLQRLAKRLNADFHVLSSPGWTANLSSVAWVRLAAMGRMQHYDRVIWCDADILPNTRTLTDADLLLLTRGGPPRLAVDQGMPVSDERFVRWVETVCLRGLHFTPKITVKLGRPYYNAGLMSLPGRLCYDLWNQFKCFGAPDVQFHDQDFINLHFQKHGTIIEPLPVEMNWMAPQFHETTLKEAKMIHFGGALKEHIPGYDNILPPDL